MVIEPAVVKLTGVTISTPSLTVILAEASAPDVILIVGASTKARPVTVLKVTEPVPSLVMVI